MKSSIRLYDKDTIRTFQWPETKLGLQAKSSLIPFLEEGVEKYVSNVKTQFYLLVVDDVVIPLTVNEKEYQNSYVASNYYAVAGLGEWLSKATYPFPLLKRPMEWTIGNLLKWVKINQVVLVNNWLFSTNPYPFLNETQVAEIASCLRERFPDHIHIFRGVNTLKGKELYNALKKEAFTLIGIREIYVYDPKKKDQLSPKVLYHHRRDLRLIETHDYTPLEKGDISTKDLPRLLELYQQIYLEKYTSYSPSYTLSFLQNALENETIDFIGVKKEGKIDGIMGLRILNGVMTVPFFGYDVSVPQSTGLYRMMSVLAIKEAEKREVILNDSSGASTPKKFRGLKPHQEYLAVYDRHVSLNRRLFWNGAGFIMNKIICPISKKLKQ